MKKLVNLVRHRPLRLRIPNVPHPLHLVAEQDHHARGLDVERGRRVLQGEGHEVADPVGADGWVGGGQGIDAAPVEDGGEEGRGGGGREEEVWGLRVHCGWLAGLGWAFGLLGKEWVMKSWVDVEEDQML